jgi:dihydrofolate synthase/folylpolyglutamate synthase
VSAALDFDGVLARLADAVRFGIHPSLDGIRLLCGALGDPQDELMVVQVAGTNGKTSVARMTAALLDAHGTRTGLFTSPTLGPHTDQIQIAGRDLTREAFASAVNAAVEAQARTGIEATEFELTTAAALWAMQEARVSWAVLEVGMGGRWDATSIASPTVAVVTGVDVDHQEQLGPSREAIAREKAAILSHGGRTVLGPGVAGVLEVFLARAAEVDSPVSLVTETTVAGDVVFEIVSRLSTPGGRTVLDVATPHGPYAGLSVGGPAYQAANAATAVAAAEAALGHRLDARIVREAFDALAFPGRFEMLSDDPPVICDGAHNPAAARVLADAIREAFASEEPVVVLGVLADKDAAGIVEALAPIARGFVVTASASPRAIPPQALARVVESVTGDRPRAAPTVAEALELIAGSPTVVTGSLTVAGEARDDAFRER